MAHVVLEGQASVRARVMNPDELETQIMVPGPAILLPDGPAPQCLGALLAAIQVCPPQVDPSMQLKQPFKALVAAAAKKGKHLEGTGFQTMLGLFS